MESRNILVLSWIVGERCYAENIMGEDINLTENMLKFPDSLRDQQAQTADLKRFFSLDLWEKFQEKLKTLKKRKWTCSFCAKTIQNKSRSVQCDRCLSWTHFTCSKIKKNAAELIFYCVCCKSTLAEGLVLSLFYLYIHIPCEQF